MLLALLPDALQGVLLSEWIDPEADLRAVAEQVLGLPAFRRLVALRGHVHVLAPRLPSPASLDWLAQHAVPMRPVYTTSKQVISHRPLCYRHEWRCNGKRHRDGDLPAVVEQVGWTHTRRWFQHGRLHRDGDLPAEEVDNGRGVTRIWYQHGEMVRRDGDGSGHLNAFEGTADLAPVEAVHFARVLQQVRAALPPGGLAAPS